MKQLLIYDRPVVLNRARHRNLRIAATEGDFHFAAGLNSLPLAASEFARAACDHPILFAGTDAANVVPAALLGLRAGENLAVDAEGRWARDCYIPAFLRRYPFVLAEKEAEGEGEDFHVCLDEAFPGLGDKDGEPLFDEAGANTPLLDTAMRFLQEYQAHLKRTREFTTRLAELDLLVPRVVQVKPANGAGFNLDGLFVVDETRLHALKGRVLQDLLRSGDLGWIHVHLMSLVNVERLCRRLDARMGETSPAH